MGNVLVIYGGHRRHGNTEAILDNVIQGMGRSEHKIEKVVLTELNILPCTSCYVCGRQGRCCIKDDMEVLYDKIMSSNILILASPIYFGSVSSVSKTMIDRCQTFWSAKYIAGLRVNAEKKRGYFVTTAGSNAGEVFQAVKYTVRLFFLACGAEYCGELMADGTDEIPVVKNTDVLKDAVDFGRAII